MKNKFVILLIVLLSFVSCNKNDSGETSGTATINNERFLSQTYYVYGFLFSRGELVATTANPSPDITIDTDGTSVFFAANNYKSSFYKAGEYSDETAAKSAFDDLKTVNVTDWEEWANPLKENQIWIYRTGTECYAKIRIVTLLKEIRNERNYTECTFEWVYQPDGTTTFPAK